MFLLAFFLGPKKYFSKKWYFWGVTLGPKKKVFRGLGVSNVVEIRAQTSVLHGLRKRFNIFFGYFLYLGGLLGCHHRALSNFRGVKTATFGSNGGICQVRKFFFKIKPCSKTEDVNGVYQVKLLLKTVHGYSGNLPWKFSPPFRPHSCAGWSPKPDLRRENLETRCAVSNEKWKIVEHGSF